MQQLTTLFDRCLHLLNEFHGLAKGVDKLNGEYDLTPKGRWRRKAEKWLQKSAVNFCTSFYCFKAVATPGNRLGS